MRAVARWCYVNRRIVLAAWIAALVALTAIHSVAGSAYNDNFRLPGTQSFDAVRLLERSAPKASGDTEQVVIAVKHGTVRNPAVRVRVQRMLAALIALPHVTTVGSPYDPGGAKQISPSGRIAFANVTFNVQSNAIKTPAAQKFVGTARQWSGHGVQIEVGGQVAESASQSGAGGLPFGFLVAGLVLFGVFGSLLAMALPLLTAALSLGIAVAVIGLSSHVIGMPTFSNELSLLIGLGVGVDYALFILTRYRQGLLRGLTGERAVVEAVDTSGRAPVRRNDRVHRDARPLGARPEPDHRRGHRRVDRGRLNRGCRVDAASGAARLLRPAGASPARAPGAAARRTAHQRRVFRLGAVGRFAAPQAGPVRRDRERGAGGDRASVLLDAVGLRGWGHRSLRVDQPQGV